MSSPAGHPIIDTEYGPAHLHWYEATEAGDAGWVLRYSNGRQEHLDEILVANDHGDVAAARVCALAFLVSERIGAGRRLRTGEAAELAGLGSAASWRADVSAGRAPARNGQYDARSPWWWETSVMRTLAARTGRWPATEIAAR